jgi:hypothetical protein
MRCSSRTALITLALVCAGSSANAAQETVVFSIPDTERWRDGSVSEHEVPGQVLLTEIVPVGSVITDWHELISQENFVALSLFGSDPREALEKFQAIFEVYCPGVTEWKILDESIDSLVYEAIRSGPCREYAAELELGKIMISTTGWRLRYNVKGTAWEPGQRDYWFEGHCHVK